MKERTRILILEDEITDVELAVRELRRSELEFEYRRAESKDQFVCELSEFGPDIVLSDYSLPQFNGLDALNLLRDVDPNIPFILCTGSLTEEVAVRCMKAGVTDYILKSSLKRLPSAVLNALEVAESRRTREVAIEALKTSEQEFRAIVETTNEWIWALNLKGKITYSNPAVEDILGFECHELIGNSVLGLLHGEDVTAATKFFEGVRAKKCGWSQLTTRFVDKTGTIKYLEGSSVPAFDASGELVGFRGSARDVTERKLAEERLRHKAFHDELTGLPNRTSFMRVLEALFDKSKDKPAETFAVLLVDMDRFKIINDSLGYAQGDELLKMFADRLVQSIRPRDTAARLGGDDFTILLNELAGQDDAMAVVERLRNDIAAPFKLGGRDIFMSASIGIAMGDVLPDCADDMVRQADTAMYCAKARGLGSYQFFHPEMHQQAVTQLQLENEMRLGLERDEFCIYYQPIVKLCTGELAGFEALIRWNHPTRGLVMPGDFIPAAEASGLILSIGRWTLQESSRQLHTWQLAYPSAASLSVSVNLSCKQFLQTDLASQIASILAATNLDADSLKLEITESHIMDDSERAVRTMRQLRDLGIQLSLDDFGTGYSSLSYLHRLPASFLKIDRSFVMRMTESTENMEVVSTIIKLARNLHMKVVAEGIETAEQLQALENLGCDYGQGYHFARPLEKGVAAEWLEAHESHRITIDTSSPGLKLIG